MKKTPLIPPTGDVDWTKIRKRLDDAAAAVVGSLQLSPEKARKVMEERAVLLARVPPQAPDAAEVLQLVTFALAEERYAIETRHVWEVVRITENTPLPGAPKFLVGVTNLRGDILALFDLRKFFDLPERELTDQSRILVLGSERAEFGILADATYEVTTIRTDEVHETPGSVSGIGREYLAGVTREALIILDGNVLLRDGRLFVDEAE